MKAKYKKLDYNTENLESLSNLELKKLGDYWLRQYLLNNTAGFGERIYCELKKQSYHRDRMHVCHYKDRANLWTRYDLLNCHLFSAQSNTWDSQIQVEGYKSLHHKDYSEWLVREYGVTILHDLCKKSEKKEVFRKEDYIDVINKFRNGH